MWDDLRQALQSLLQKPGHTLLTVLTLACGMSFAIFSAAVYLGLTQGELPFPEPERLLAFETLRDGSRTQANSVLYADYLEYQQGLRSLEGLHALQRQNLTLRAEQRTPEVVSAAKVPAAVWPWLGVIPELGRLPDAQDERAGAPPVVALGAELWQRYLGGDRKIIGQVLHINGVAHTVVGVLPARLRFPMNQQLWIPFQAPPIQARAETYSMGTAQHVMLLGRMKPGSSRAQVQKEADWVSQQLQQRHPKSHGRLQLLAMPYASWGLSDADMLYTGLGAAALLLLALVSINAGNLLLVRANERRQEMAVRQALGAPRGRLVRLMLCEALWLNMAAVALGLFFAAWALALIDQAVRATADGQVPFWVRFHLSAPALGFGLLLGLLTTLIVGTLPAWRGSDVDVNAVLRDGHPGSTGRAAGRTSRWLVGLQIFLASFLLLCAGALSYDSYDKLQAGTGARVQQVLTARLAPRQARYQAPEARRQLIARFEAQLREEAERHGLGVAIATALPGGGIISTSTIRLTDRSEPLDTGLYAVNADYFKTLEVPLIAGREFNSADRSDSAPVAIVNAALAERLWPGQEALGKTLSVEGDAPGSFRAVTVVGVVRNVHQGAATRDARRGVNLYQPLSQSEDRDWELGLVGAEDSPQMRALLQRALGRTDPELALERLRSAEERERVAYAGTDILIVVSTVLGLMGLLLTISGIYGVTQRAVDLRRKEIAVHRAVGAPDARVLGLLLRRSAWQLALSLPLGLLLGLAAMTEATALGVALGVFALLVGGFIATLVGLATAIPALRALRLTPQQALHHD